MVNYTKEQVKELVVTYGETPTKATVEKLASGMGKSVRSIISKLATEGVYQKVKKASSKPIAVKKAALVNVIRIMMNARDNQFKSFENASKADLEAMVDLLRDLNNQYELKERKWAKTLYHLWHLKRITTAIRLVRKDLVTELSVVNVNLILSVALTGQWNNVLKVVEKGMVFILNVAFWLTLVYLTF